MTLLRTRTSPLLLFFLTLSTGCVPSTGMVERGLERELQTLIGPAEDYDVNIEGLRARAGEANRVVVVGRRVRIADAPVLDRLEADLWGVQYNRDQRRVERVDSASVTALVRPEDMATFLEDNPNLEDVSVAFQAPNTATIQARPTISGFSLPSAVEISGRLRTEAGTVRYDVTDVRAGGLSAGGALARRLTEAINPVVDLTNSPIGLRVTDVRVENGLLRLDGTGSIER